MTAGIRPSVPRAIGAGAIDAITQRVTLATDSPLVADLAAILARLILINNVQADRTQMAQITDGVTDADVIVLINSLKTDLSSVAGTVTAANSGNLTAGTQRVAIATDDVNVAAIRAAIAQHLGAGPANAILAGLLAIAGVPVEEAAGDIAAPWMDTFRRLVIYGADLAQGAINIADVAPASMQVLIETGWAALTAAGTYTPWINVQDYCHHTVKYVTSGLTALESLDCIIWGSLDGTATDFPMDTWNIPGNAAGIVKNAREIASFKVRHLRVELDAINGGGGNEAITFQYMGGLG